MKYTINNEKIVFDEHYKILKADVTYDTFNNDEINTTRFAFERGDSVAIILLDKESNSILLTNQFRYPTCKHNNGWLLEIPAGSLEENEEPMEAIKREVLEEMGYKISDPKHINTFYTSPGGSTERVFLFFSKVSLNDKIQKGGGKEDENEDIQTVKIPLSQLKQRFIEIKDAKSLVAVQWFLLNKF